MSIRTNSLGGLYRHGASLGDDRLEVAKILLAYAEGEGAELHDPSAALQLGLCTAEWTAISRAVQHTENTCKKYVRRLLEGAPILADGRVEAAENRSLDVLGYHGRYALLVYVRAYASNNLQSYVEWIGTYLGTLINRKAISVGLDYLGITLKSLDKIYSESLTPRIIGMVRAHTAFFVSVAKNDELDDHYWVDVTGFHEADFSSSRGRSQAGTAAQVPTRSDRGRHFDLILAIHRQHGCVGCMVVEGHVNFLVVGL